MNASLTSLWRTRLLGLVEGLPREVELAAVSPDAAIVFASDYMRDFATAFFTSSGGVLCSRQRMRRATSSILWEIISSASISFAFLDSPSGA